QANLRDPGIDLAAGQLAAFTGLGALGHFDLQFLRLHEIKTRHAKTPRGNLLDGAVARIAVRIENITRGVFATFARVALAADAIHRDGETLVGFFADRAVRHRARLEALHDGLDWLDFLNGNRRGRFEVKQTTQRIK